MEKTKRLGDLLFSRNMGLISPEEQEELKRTSIAIAGVGGDGGLLAERLCRFGIGELIIADPDLFDTTNINRQFGCDQNTIGKNKAEVIASSLRLINPELVIHVFPEGVSKNNVNEIVSQADIIVDEIDFSCPEVSVLLHRTARENSKSVFMGANIGWGASIFCFEPDGMTFEDFFGYDEERHAINIYSYFPDKPDYVTQELLNSVLKGEIPVPGVASSISLVAAALSTEIILAITKKNVDQQ